MARPSSPLADPRVITTKSKVPVPRCRTRIACNGATDNLKLLRVPTNGITMIQLCCPACAAMAA